MLSDALLEQSIAIKGTVFRVRFGVWTPSAETHRQRSGRPHRARVAESLWLLRGPALATDVYHKQQPGSLRTPHRPRFVAQETVPHPRWRARARGRTRCASTRRVQTFSELGTRTTCSLDHHRLSRLSSCGSAFGPSRFPRRRAPSSSSDAMRCSRRAASDVEIRASVVSRLVDKPPSPQQPSPPPLLTPITRWSNPEWSERPATMVGLPISACATRGVSGTGGFFVEDGERLLVTARHSTTR